MGTDREKEWKEHSERMLAEAIPQAGPLARAWIANPGMSPKEAWDLRNLLCRIRFFRGVIDADLVRELVFTARPLRPASDHIFGISLILLAQYLPDVARPIALDLMHTDDRGIKYHVGAALLESHGLPSQYDVDSVMTHQQFPLQAPQVRYVSAVTTLEVQVCNGGFSQWFDNWYGVARWRDTIEGCKAIGAPRIAALVERAVEAIGTDAFVSGSEFETARLVSQRGDKVRELLGSLDDLFYDDPEGTSLPVARYMHANPRPFLDLRVKLGI